jgi:diadenosine tetraphosphate (Ap4A) HIT family hydrolase
MEQKIDSIEKALSALKHEIQVDKKPCEKVAVTLWIPKADVRMFTELQKTSKLKFGKVLQELVRQFINEAHKGF